MYVVLDTSVINKDYDLSNPATAYLLENAPGRNVMVCIPEIVVQEMVAHYRQRIESARDELTRAREKLAKHLGRDISVDVVADEVENSVTAVERQFRELLRARGIRVLPMPRAGSNVQVLLRRDFADRRPFNQKRGMRDALIWESVLELCTGENRPLALITNNRKDFADESGNLLHPHLLEDLKALGFPAGNAELYRSIQDFNEARLNPFKSISEGREARHPTEGSSDSSRLVQSESDPGRDQIKPGPAVSAEHAAEDEFILQHPVSEARKQRFLEDFKANRRRTATLEMVFERQGAFHSVATRSGKENLTAGFDVLVFKGPFVDGSNLLPPRSWSFAIGIERYLLDRLEEGLREATQAQLGPSVNRDAQSVLQAADAMAADLHLRGYAPTLLVIAGTLGLQVHVDIVKMIQGEWEAEVQRALRTTHRILGMYGGIPILHIQESMSPAMYAVDLAQFATLARYGDEPEFAIDEFDYAQAKDLLTKHPELISSPPPEPGNEEARIRQLRLRVRLRMYETYELTVSDRDAVVGRPLVGPVLD